MRVLELPAITFFYVSNQPTAKTNLDRDLDLLLESLYQAKPQANLTQVGPDITRYYQAEGGEPDQYWMEVGIAVEANTPPAGEARVKVLPAYRCAAVLLWGGLGNITEAYNVLMQSMKEAGLAHTGDTREINYAFEAPFSPNNLMGIYMGIGGVT
jgi:effector-binding domain-containing protein